VPLLSFETKLKAGRKTTVLCPAFLVVENQRDSIQLVVLPDNWTVSSLK